MFLATRRFIWAKAPCMNVCRRNRKWLLYIHLRLHLSFFFISLLLWCIDQVNLITQIIHLKNWLKHGVWSGRNINLGFHPKDWLLMRIQMPLLKLELTRLHIIGKRLVATICIWASKARRTTSLLPPVSFYVKMKIWVDILRLNLFWWRTGLVLFG